MNVQIIQSVPVDMNTAVAALWVDEGAGFYEFGIQKGGELVEVSQAQYGNPVAALRDGLSSWLGDR